MDPSTSTSVKYGGQSIRLRFDACRVLLGGEFAGNIELDVACDASDIESIVRCLRLRVPDTPPSDTAFGDGPYSPGVELDFWIEPSHLAALPESVTVLWGDTPIASIEPTLKDSVPIGEQVVFTDPMEILGHGTLPVTTSNDVLLAAQREPWWFALTALLVVLGGLVAAALPGLEFSEPMLNGLLGGAMVTSGVAVGLFLGARPPRQVWLDRDRRRILFVEGRTRNPQKRFADAPGRSLDDFDHVRVYQRWNLATGVEDHDQEVWIVTLEGPIPFASEDGVVHLHDEAIRVGEFASEIAARRMAAVVGFHTGLKILDTGHDRTA